MTFFRKAVLLFCFSPAFFWMVGCSPVADEQAPVRSRAQMVLDSAISYHGDTLYKDLHISFTFRNREITADRQGGIFSYTMRYTDSTGTYERVLNNNGFTELLDGGPLIHNAKDSAARAASVNSIVYFALVPGLLKDAAVLAKYDGEDQIADKSYHRIEVRFTPENGGEDHSDVYLYWFDKEDYSMDYFAYSYYTDEGGTRFRKAVNSRRVNGLVLQDYLNYRGPAAPDSLPEVLALYKSGDLDSLSTIALTRILLEPVK